jgi:hypothetical protein
VVQPLRVFRHHLLGSGAPRPPAVLSGFTLRKDKQAVALPGLRRKREAKQFLLRWLDESKEFRIDVEHVLGTLNPVDPLSRRGLPAPARPSRPIVFSDDHASEKAYNIVGSETFLYAVAAVLEGGLEINLRAFMPLNSPLRAISPCHPPNHSPSSTSLPRRSWTHGSKSCSQTHS